MATMKTTDDKKVKETPPLRCDVDENGWCHTHKCYMSNCPLPALLKGLTK
jgi:hypothetical protein